MYPRVYNEEKREYVFVQGKHAMVSKQQCTASLVMSSSHREFQCINKIVTVIKPRHPSAEVTVFYGKKKFLQFCPVH
jgi:hypothetical protein